MIIAFLIAIVANCKEQNEEEVNTNRNQLNGQLLIDISGSFGDTGHYDIQDDILTISGQSTIGPCDDLTACPYKEYSNSVKKVIIENDVTTLSNNVFNDFEQLESVELAESVIYIGDNAFSNCPKLVSINLPENVFFLSANAFYHCSSLQSITLPAKVNAISNELFSGCTSLKSIFIRGNINTIGASAFANCPGLNAIYYYGTNSPTVEESSFDDPFNGHVYITKEYLDEKFGNFPVSLIPTQVFTATNGFTETNCFTKTNFFTETSHFSSSSQFTKSDFIKTFSDSKTSALISNTILSITGRMTYSVSFSLSYVDKKSVSFSLSYLLSNSFIISFDVQNDDFINVVTQTYYQRYFPYIIHYLSPTYVPTYFTIFIFRHSRFSSEQIIGIVCGTASVFFLIIGGTLLIISKKKDDAIRYIDDFYDISDSDCPQIIQRDNGIDEQNEDLSSCSKESVYYD